MRSNLVKSKLKRGQLSVGSWLSIGDESVAEIMCQAGFEWIAVDMEHSAITLDSAQRLIRVIDLAGTIPLVRVPSNDSIVIKRVMDAGAHGVIVPFVNTAEEAGSAVKAVQYPPEGSRGVGLARAQGYGASFPEYKRWLKTNALTVVQIEHIEGVQNLEEILKVEGVDGTLIGPYDLSASLGFPGEFNRPAFKKAIQRYEQVCRRLRKPMGFHVVQPDISIAARHIKMGYQFLALGLDSLYLGLKCRETLQALKSKRSR